MKGIDRIIGWDSNVALRYDKHERCDEEEAVKFLLSYAEGGNALGFAIGTAPIAMPLRERGI